MRRRANPPGAQAITGEMHVGSLGALSPCSSQPPSEASEPCPHF